MTMLLLLAMCVLGTQAAFHPTECGKMQSLKVKTEWSEAYGSPQEREKMNDDLWAEIFQEKPEWRDQFFSRVHGDNILSPEFRAHASRISSALDMLINFLMFDDLFEQHVVHLANFHKELGIPADAFPVFVHAIIDAVHHRVGRCFDHDAWVLCTTKITDGIQANL